VAVEWREGRPAVNSSNEIRRSRRGPGKPHQGAATVADMSYRTGPWVAFAMLLCSCQSGDTTTVAQIANADVGPVVGAGFSAALRADLARSTGIAAPPVAKPAAVPPKSDGTAKGAAAAEPVARPAAATKSTAAIALTKPTAAPNPPTVTAAPVIATGQVSGAAATAGTAAGLPAELASIKLKLNEGWQRDSAGPGTFSFFAPGDGGKNIRFVFKYGYELATAPLQREPYKQWLNDNKIMTVTTDRQRGAAWFLEGSDAIGEATFRYVITYGGRLLVCNGSLHKQGAASALRDLRDEIIMQAKRICESMDL
jgi:hypothetical protein